MTAAKIIQRKASRVAIAVTTLITALAIGLGGLSPVGAETYDTCTYGSGSYDYNDDCDTTTTTAPSSGQTSSTPQSSSGSSGSTSTGTGSGAASTPAPSTVVISGATVTLNDYPEYTSTTGKSLTFKVGDVIHFTLGGNAHTITIKSITANTLTVTIASTPTDVNVPIGQTVNYDVDQDGTPDIAITYNAAASDASSATADFRALGTATTPAATTTSGASQNTSTGGTTAAPTSKSSSFWWVWIIPVVIGLLLLAWAVAAARKRKAAQNGGGNFTGGSSFNQY